MSGRRLPEYPCTSDVPGMCKNVSKFHVYPDYPSRFPEEIGRKYHENEYVPGFIRCIRIFLDLAVLPGMSGMARGRNPEYPGTPVMSVMISLETPGCIGYVGHGPIRNTRVCRVCTGIAPSTYPHRYLDDLCV